MGKETTTQLREKEKFIATIQVQKTALYYPENKDNLHTSFTSNGVRVVSLLFPNKNGNSTNINVGFTEEENIQL